MTEAKIKRAIMFPAAVASLEIAYKALNEARTHLSYEDKTWDDTNDLMIQVHRLGGEIRRMTPDLRDLIGETEQQEEGG